MMIDRRLSAGEIHQDKESSKSDRYTSSLFGLAKISINPAARYVRLEIPSYYLLLFRNYSLSLDESQLVSGKLWNIFSFMSPFHLKTSIPIRGFETNHDRYLVELSKKKKRIFLNTKVFWLLSGRFKHISFEKVTRYSWKLRAQLENVRNLNTTPWEHIEVSSQSRRRIPLGFRRRKQRVEKLKRDSQFSNDGKLMFLGNSKSVEVGMLDKLPKNYDLVAFNRFVSSYHSHSLRENLLVSADKKMIRDHGKEMLERASHGLLFISSVFQIGKKESLNFRKEMIEKDVFRSDLSGSIQTFGSSPVFGLQACLSLSPRIIVFYGLDMSFPSGVGSSKIGRGLTSGEGNHFFPNYRGGKEWYRPNWERILKGYFMFSLIAENQGIELLNMTPANHVPLRAERLADPSGLEFE